MASINFMNFEALFGAMLAVGIIISLGVYVYCAFAWMTIAKKLGYKKAWLAWIPIANLFLYPILADKDWVWGFILLVPIVNVVFFFMWTWQIFEKRKYPGWLSLIPLLSVIPFLNIVVVLAYLVVLGVVAWNDKA